MTVLTFVEYIEPTTTASGKTTPPKAKANGKTWALAKSTVELIRNSLGTPLECETKSEQNGKWWNHSVLSARHIVAAAGPESPTFTSPEPHEMTRAPLLHGPSSKPPPTTQEGPVPTSPAPAWQNTDAARQRLIVRQSSLRAAVDWLNAEDETPEEVLALADQFTRWVFEEEQVDRGLNGGGGDKAQGAVPAARPAEKSAPHAISQAQEHLETARQRQAEIRAGYDDSDAVCPGCGRKEWLKQWDGGWFCSKKDGGCGHPPKGERLDFPMTYGEWRQRASSGLRRPDAPLVGPTSHPTR